MKVLKKIVNGFLILVVLFILFVFGYNGCKKVSALDYGDINEVDLMFDAECPNWYGGSTDCLLFCVKSMDINKTIGVFSGFDIRLTNGYLDFKENVFQNETITFPFKCSYYVVLIEVSNIFIFGQNKNSDNYYYSFDMWGSDINFLHDDIVASFDFNYVFGYYIMDSSYFDFDLIHSDMVSFLNFYLNDFIDNTVDYSYQQGFDFGYTDGEFNGYNNGFQEGSISALLGYKNIEGYYTYFESTINNSSGFVNEFYLYPSQDTISFIFYQEITEGNNNILSVLHNDSIYFADTHIYLDFNDFDIPQEISFDFIDSAYYRVKFIRDVYGYTYLDLGYFDFENRYYSILSDYELFDLGYYTDIFIQSKKPVSNSLNLVKLNYDLGYNDGLSQNIGETSAMSWLSSIVDGTTRILDLHLAPNITIGTLLAIPLVLGLVILIIKFIRG